MVNRGDAASKILLNSLPNHSFLYWSGFAFPEDSWFSEIWSEVVRKLSRGRAFMLRLTVSWWDIDCLRADGISEPFSPLWPMLLGSRAFSCGNDITKFKSNSLLYNWIYSLVAWGNWGRKLLDPTSREWNPTFNAGFLRSKAKLALRGLALLKIASNNSSIFCPFSFCLSTYS